MYVIFILGSHSQCQQKVNRLLHNGALGKTHSVSFEITSMFKIPQLFGEKDDRVYGHCTKF